jgi:hypothetical protein
MVVPPGAGEVTRILQVPEKGNAVKKKIVGLIVAALLVLLGIAFLQSPANAATQAAPVGSHATWKIAADGSLIPTNATAKMVDQTATAYPPTTPGARYRFLFSTNNLERMICIKDYTVTGDSTWVPKWSAQLWDAASNKFGMVWDDMNGNGSAGESNCISYDDSQTIKMYSYNGTEADGCGEVSIWYNADQWLSSAVVQLNTGGRYRSCLYTQVLRQNIVVGATGKTLGLLYFDAAGVSSVMNQDLLVAQSTSAPTQNDKNALAVKYQYS